MLSKLFINILVNPIPSLKISAQLTTPVLFLDDFSIPVDEPTIQHSFLLLSIIFYSTFPQLPSQPLSIIFKIVITSNQNGFNFKHSTFCPSSFPIFFQPISHCHSSSTTISNLLIPPFFYCPSSTSRFIFFYLPSLKFVVPHCNQSFV